MNADPITCGVCGEQTWVFTAPGIAGVTVSLSDRYLAMSNLLKGLWRRSYIRSECKTCGHVLEIWFSDKQGFIDHVRAKMNRLRIAGVNDMPDESLRDWAKENLTVEDDLEPFVTVQGRVKD